MKRVVFALCLMVVTASSEACSRTPTASREAQPLAAFQPYLTRELTPSAARTRFGAPDEETGSGLLIYKYRVDGGRTLWLSFPGYAPIVSARLENKDGTLTDLALR